MNDDKYCVLSKATKNNISKAGQLINNGDVVIFPTETVYGIGADATNSDAVAKIFNIKQRPNYNPLITHVRNLEQAKEYAIFNDNALKLAHEFCPGGLTLVLPKTHNNTISPLVTAGLNTIALRIPDNQIALELLQQSKKPICAPSANMFQTLSTTDAKHVVNNFGDSIKLVSMIIDGGECLKGLESTIIGCYDDKITLLRKGIISKKQVEDIIGEKINNNTEHYEAGKANSNNPAPISAGQLKKHYSPKSRLRINATNAKENELLLAFGKVDDDFATLNLSPTGDLHEAARNFFTYMNVLDTMVSEFAKNKNEKKSIAVMPIPNIGIGEAINDKLNRAIHN